jgi:Fuc2NAc and GlcNAc transferase
MLFTILISLASSAGLTVAVERFARNRGVLDVPNARSSHTVPTPRGGGLGIVLSCYLAIALCFAFGSISGKLTFALAGGLLVAAVGFWDDYRGLSPAIRLGAHIAASAWAVIALGGLPALDLGFAVPHWKLLGGVLAVVGIVGAINITNFMDGIDGLAGSEVGFVCLAGGGLLMLEGEAGPASLCWAVAAACAGFLLFNWHPARIFMGDVGSGFLGFTAGTLMLAHAARRPSALWPWLILFGVFAVDAAVTLLRRAWSGARIHEAHCTHAYQHAARRFGHSATTLAVLAINLFWLAPLAWVAWALPRFGLAALIVAYAPMVMLAWRFGAGCASTAPSESSVLITSSKHASDTLGDAEEEPIEMMAEGRS